MGGRVIGETNPKPVLDEKDKLKDVTAARTIDDVHATIVAALGLSPTKELMTPINRPLAISPGKPIRELLA
jgi:hypothetical protein